MAIYTPRNEVGNRTILADVLPIDTPYVIGIFLGDVCNFKCKYCIQSTDDALNNEDLIKRFLDLDTFQIIAHQIKEFPKKIKKILFSSIGEPLLNNKLPEMLKFINSIDAAEKYELVTNASLLTHEMSKALVDAGLSKLCISVQGVTNEQYKRICGYNINMNDFINIIRYFYEYSRGRCKVHVKTVDAVLENDGDYEQFMQMFSSVCDTIYVDRVIEMYEGINISDINKSVHMFMDGCTSQIDVCSLPFYTMYVLANGDIVPCCRVPYPIHYDNIFNKSLLQVWNGKKRLDFLKMHLRKYRYNHHVCGKCVLPQSVEFKEDILDDYANNILERM